MLNHDHNLIAQFNTRNYAGYNIKFSPIRHDTFACVLGKNYGLVDANRINLKGNGRLTIMNFDGSNIHQTVNFIWPSDVLLDLAWSRKSENKIATSTGDGYMIIWDLENKRSKSTILTHLNHEVSSIDWSNNLIITGSWDKSIGLWDPNKSILLLRFKGHTNIINQVRFLNDSTILSVSNDGNCLVWDVRSPTGDPSISLRHNKDVLCNDWIDEFCIITGDVGGTIKSWDLRMSSKYINSINAHKYGIKKLIGRKLNSEVVNFFSCSYDCKTKFWETNMKAGNILKKSLVGYHTEFVYGLDQNPFMSNWIVDCSWDNFINLYSI